MEFSVDFSSVSNRCCSIVYSSASSKLSSHCIYRMVQSGGVRRSAAVRAVCIGSISGTLLSRCGASVASGSGSSSCWKTSANICPVSAPSKSSLAVAPFLNARFYLLLCVYTHKTIHQHQQWPIATTLKPETPQQTVLIFSFLFYFSPSPTTSTLFTASIELKQSSLASLYKSSDSLIRLTACPNINLTVLNLF